jgi:hypothetical protein
MSVNSLPLLRHALDSASALTPERLMDAVRRERGLAVEAVPPLCVLDFDGDLSDRLAEQGITRPMASWACFHTSMRVLGSADEALFVRVPTVAIAEDDQGEIQ